ncbi:MAG TPA: adenosine kinase [Bacteroidales bacterium]|nr:adenosine kinase [Bacteroidales bacterium]
MKKILGIGNALVDVILFMENGGLLDTFSLPKGSMQLVDADKALRVEEAARLLKKHLASGGSAANTIYGLANLGVETAFIGTVGNDAMGTFFEKDLRDSGINPILAHSPTNTGRAISLVLPGGERTFATYLGAALELDSGQLDPDQFSAYAHLHLEGYLVPNKQLAETAFDIARQLGMTVSLDLASYNVVEANLAFLKQIITRYNPVVFANEEEARAFTGQEDPRKALEVLASGCDTAVVKTGAKGSLVCHMGKYYKAEAIPVNCIDTTGAGDLYAAGYLYGYINEFDPEKCGRLGSLLAGKVIEEPGAKISPAGWDYIRAAIRTSRG